MSRSDMPFMRAGSQPMGFMAYGITAVLVGASLLDRLGGWPIVRFGLQGPAPGVERVVHHQSVPEHFVVVGKVGRETERNREQTTALRAQIMARRVGASHDLGEVIERPIFDVVDTEDGVERATLAFVREFDAF